MDLKAEARKFVKTGILPLYMHSLKRREAEAFWAYERAYKVEADRKEKEEGIIC